MRPVLSTIYELVRHYNHRRHHCLLSIYLAVDGLLNFTHGKVTKLLKLNVFEFRLTLFIYLLFRVPLFKCM